MITSDMTASKLPPPTAAETGQLTATDWSPLKQQLLQVLIATNLLLGFLYLSWRYTSTIHWAAWPISLALLAAETYSYLDAWLFGAMMWRLKQRQPPPAPPPGATVDVYITCYNEAVELVRETALAAKAIQYPHQTYILDDGNTPAMQAMAASIGVGYITRTPDWLGYDRHAKSGNLNNAIFQTQGEFLLILDADQIPAPTILHRVLGYFQDPTVAFVQTPQWFYNVPPGDPFGCQAPLFYGPIQQGKDGWNAAFFCGSNAVLRREAVMQLGLIIYVRETEQRIKKALATASRSLRQVDSRLVTGRKPQLRAAVQQLREAVDQTRRALRTGRPVQAATWEFQRRAQAASLSLVSDDLARIRTDLAAIPGLDEGQIANGHITTFGDTALMTLSSRTVSPLTAIKEVRELLVAVDLDRADEALPIMPFATISVTEDMATAMRLHSLGWRSVYHDEILARGLAPDDLRSALQQRLRWAQGTIQVMLRENPLLVAGLSVGQRLMYIATMWSYLSGWFGPVYLIAPVLFLIFGISPTRTDPVEFLWRLLPFLVINQLVFLVVSWGRPSWRGQQYSLALFPIWIKSVTSAVSNVYRGRKLGFIVTPKTRQDGVHLHLIWPQLMAMVALVGAVMLGLTRLALGATDDGLPILINTFWAIYDIIALSVVLDAATYQPDDLAASPESIDDDSTMAKAA